MPFTKSDYLGSYTPSQLDTLQSAYNEVCHILNRCPLTDENREVLARTVIRIYEQGQKDPHIIARKIAEIEELLF